MLKDLFNKLLSVEADIEPIVAPAATPEPKKPAASTPAAPAERPEAMRRMPRIPLRIKADLSWESGHGSGMTANVSLSGCRVAMAIVAAAGTPVRVTFALPNCSPVTLEGQVVHAFADGIAVLFTLPAQDQFVPYFFSYRHGEAITRLIDREDLPIATSSTLYVIGCPPRFTTSQLVSLVSPCGDAESTTITRLDEGTIATVAMATPASAVLVQQTFHRQMVGGSPLFVYLRGTRTAELLRVVLQQNALRRFATENKSGLSL